MAAFNGRKQNRLAGEKSPYLIQHAYNPVDWRPWGADAFAAATNEDKPVFLSIGYSTCHWCHVMERESFEDEETAALLNESFVSVKVDREERPDIDRVYMDVCTAMTGNGGWPLTVIMTPDRKPFFIGTYFPPEDMRGMRGLKNILRAITAMWKDRRQDVLESAGGVAEFMKKEKISAAGYVSEDLLHDAFRQLDSMFDPVYGGIGAQGPKFPQAHQFTFLTRYWRRTGDPRALHIASVSLDRIISGGIYDHAGGGVHRYSTDRKWFAPHFEKMLYDQALLARALLETGQAAGNRRFLNAARDILDYVLRDMAAPDGAFYSAEDADSEGVEGKFYIWTAVEIESLLGPDAPVFMRMHGVLPGGNFENGANILALSQPLSAIAKATGMSEDALEELRGRCLRKLFDARAGRVRPHLDDKALASWNGLMIATLAYAGRVLGEEKYTNAARAAAEFILMHMTAGDGTLLRRYRDGEAAVPGFLDDYAFLTWGLIELFEATFDAEVIDSAALLAENMIARFGSAGDGVLSYSAPDGDLTEYRMPDTADGAEPSGNSVAAMVLLRLGRILGREDFERTALGILDSYAGLMKRLPMAYTQMMAAVDAATSEALDVTIASGADEAAAEELVKTAFEGYDPGRIVLYRAPGDAGARLSRAVPKLAVATPPDGAPFAQVCFDHACRLSVSKPEELREQLNTIRNKTAG